MGELLETIAGRLDSQVDVRILLLNIRYESTVIINISNFSAGPLTCRRLKYQRAAF
uniref:Uncharacterized protein n=1 Tax=Rhizophora mucronata TaxID=61149 RepID=A0A2P2J7Z7_RHIMU